MAEQQIPQEWIDRAIEALYPEPTDYRVIKLYYKRQDRLILAPLEKIFIDRTARALWQADTKAKEARESALNQAADRVKEYFQDSEWIDDSFIEEIRSLKTPPPTEASA